MRKDVSFLHTFAFLTLCAVSVLLYPAANRGVSALVWGLLALARQLPALAAACGAGVERPVFLGVKE
jgi:hypothetical protein